MLAANLSDASLRIGPRRPRAAIPRGSGSRKQIAAAVWCCMDAGRTAAARPRSKGPFGIHGEGLAQSPGGTGFVPGGSDRSGCALEVTRESSGTNGDAVRLTVELSWGLPHKGVESTGVSSPEELAGSKPEYLLELSQGRVLEAIAWPPAASAGIGGAAVGPAMGSGPPGRWRLGSDPAGQIRARLERLWMPA